MALGYTVVLEKRSLFKRELEGNEMGADPYFYFTKYQPDVNKALHALRQQEFEAGRYDPAINMHDPSMRMFKFNFPPNTQSLSPGARHTSIEAALEDSGDSGTGSILDIQKVSDSPEFLASWALSTDETLALFGTDKPTRQMLEDIFVEGDVEGKLEHWEETGYDVDDFWDTIGRGESRYIILYENDQPSEIFFIGYSVD